MTNDKAISNDAVGASFIANNSLASGMKAGGVYTVQCFDKDGNLKWEDQSHNLVVNAGLKDMNDKYFAGSSYTAAWYIGLVTGPGSGTTFAAADTLASHAGWTEFAEYSGARKAAVFAAATTADPSVVTNTSSPAAFLISGAGGVVAGAFLASVSSGTSGVLFSESDFQSPGDRTVVSGDTLNVTYTFSLDAA
tara:strand:+ start:3753 stop:4331 length:579 start_codon:yes stop_codon:yes gene_type:complete